MKNKICHITTVHQRYDVRIFHKECKSLSKQYEVYLIVADGLGDEEKDNVHILDIGFRQSSRLKRVKIDSKKVLIKALGLNCDIYHFHDPELIFIGKKLIKKGKEVIYDIHEDLPRQVMSKPYLKGFIKPILSKIIEVFENNAAKKFSGIITATDFIRDRFLKYNQNTVSVKNYPKLDEFTFSYDNSLKKNRICYIGSISKVRGINELIDSMEFIDAELNLGGNFNSEDLHAEVKAKKTWSKVIEYGFVNRKQANAILEESRVGMVTLYPTINYKDALPVKMFEYMMAEIPVVSSDIPLWKGIIDSSKCGLTVNPFDPKAIADAVNSLLNNKYLAEEMGKNGKKAVVEKYNWEQEEKILSKFYNSL